MTYYPVFLDLSEKRCLVVGGGKVAVRKVIALLRADAKVTVVATACCSRLRWLKRLITLHERPFTENDIAHGYMLVIGATNNPEVNRAISRRTAELTIPCNIVDQTNLCSFIVPAQVRRGPITVAVATGGVSPRLSRYLKTIIAHAVEPLHGDLAEYLGTIRLRLWSVLPEITFRSAFWDALFTVDPVEQIRTEGWNALKGRTEKLIASFVKQMELYEKK